MANTRLFVDIELNAQTKSELENLSYDESVALLQTRVVEIISSLFQFDTQELADEGQALPFSLFGYNISGLRPDVSKALERLINEARSKDEDYHPDPKLILTFEIAFDATDVILEILKKKNVDTDLGPATIRRAFGAPSFDPTTNPHFKNQAYMGKLGSEITYGWPLEGSRGENVKLVDIEKAWDLCHNDLPVSNASLLWGENNDSDLDDKRHGTQALGVVCSYSNNKFGVGICPQIDELRVASYYPANHPYDAMIMAIFYLVFGQINREYGNILLLEVGADEGRFPIEIDPCLHFLIDLATKLEVIVIEPAGNSGENIDQKLSKCGDSGAILVGALHPITGRILGTSSFGNRVDTWAWGRYVHCIEPVHTGKPFENTSAASAIIGGCAAMIQSIFKAYNSGAHLIPTEMRTYLKKHSHDHRTEKPLNLKAVLEEISSIPTPSSETFGGCFCPPTERRSISNRDSVWSPFLSPHQDPPFAGIIYDPLERGKTPPGRCNDPRTDKQRFDTFVHDVVECIKEHNRTLKIVKECNVNGTDDVTYNNAVRAYRGACSLFVNFLKDTELVDPETIFIDPVISNGFVIDIRVVAHPTDPVGSVFGPPNFHSESSHVSTHP